MNLLGQRSIAVAGLAVVSVFGIGWLRRSPSGPVAPSRVVHPTQRKTFTSSVVTTGELRARKFATILGPNSQTAQIFNTKITWLVPEGTYVHEGDRVAELDPAPAETRLQSVKLDLQKAEAEYTNAELDSSAVLSQAREDVRTADYALEERTLAKTQAAYEAPTIKRQAEIDFERAKRGADAARFSLDAKRQQAVAKISIAAANRARQRDNLKAVEDAIAQFTVYAPSEGLVIYLREGSGRRKGVGSTYYPWDPAVATLPDLSAMQSQTYVSEVDIRGIQIGQPVRLSLDAEPGKHLNGRVISVANVGEQRPNQDAKVFEVVVDIVESDTTLRPGMTTANSIETRTLPNVLTVPATTVESERGQPYVYVRRGSEIVKQMIEVDLAGTLDVVVKRGLTPSDEVLRWLLPTERVARTNPLPAAPTAISKLE